MEITLADKKQANQVARRHGYRKASKIILGTENRIIKRVKPGYRKNSTGEYVSFTYRSNFGWKNTYYQRAITVVEIAKEYKK